MVKKQEKIHPLNIKIHIGNDFVFLYLQLIDYPEMTKGEISLNELMKKYRFKNLKEKHLHDMIMALRQEGAFQIKEVLDDKIIIITEESIRFIKSALDLYVERFIKGELISCHSPEPYNFRKQKQLFLEKVEEKIKDSQSKMSLYDSDFDERFCFFLCFLAMVKQKEIEIVALYNNKNPKLKHFYNISFKVKARPLKRLIARQDKINHSLKCFVKGSQGYFQIKKTSEPKKIGLKNSRHYLLLEYLWKKGVDELVDFSKAYNAIKDGKEYKPKGYIEDKELYVLEKAQSYLQKKKFNIKPYKIEIYKETRKISLEHI